MELTHEFTVPVPVQEAWDHFQDIASVAECFPGAQVTDTEGATFARLGEGEARSDRAGLQRDGHVHREGRDRLPLRGRRQGQGQARQRYGGGHGHPHHGRRGRRLDRRQGAHRPRHHRQAGPVRPRRHAGRLRQAAGSVRGLPRAADGRGTARRFRRRGDCRRPRRGRRSGSACGCRCPATPAEEPTAAEASADPLPPAAPAAPAAAAPGARKAAPAAARGSDDALNLGTTVLPVLVKSYWKQALAGVVVIGVIVWVVTR